MIKLSIERNNGHWTVNGKRIKECSFTERSIFDKYIAIHKTKNQIIL